MSIVNYPKYIKDDQQLCQMFRMAVLLRLMMEDAASNQRKVQYAFRCGKYLGRLSTHKRFWFNNYPVSQDVLDEAKRIYYSLEELDDANENR